jgi:hypothetical protein
MEAYLEALAKQPTVIRHYHRTPDDVQFLIFFENDPEFGGKVLYSIKRKPFQLIEAETLRQLLGDERWALISGQPTKQLP